MHKTIRKFSHLARESEHEYIESSQNPWSLSFTYYMEEHAKPQRNIPTSGGGSKPHAFHK